MQDAEKTEIRAAGACILRKLAFPAPSPTHIDPSGGNKPAAAAAAEATKSSFATTPCRALLASLHACSGRAEAVRSLASLGLFGDDPGATPRDSADHHDDGDDGDDDDSVGSTRKKAAAQEALWKAQLRDDGAAVLVAMVATVTSSTVAAAAATPTGAGSGGAWRPRRRHGSGSGRFFGGGGGGGVDGAEFAGVGMEEFDYPESEALSGVCQEVLRALVSDEEGVCKFCFVGFWSWHFGERGGLSGLLWRFFCFRQMTPVSVEASFSKWESRACASQHAAALIGVGWFSLGTSVL